MLLAAFDIDILRPSDVLVYELGEDFWKLFENSLVEEGKLTATVNIKKSLNSIQLLFDIQGEVVLVCDRSLEVFNHTIQVEKKVVFKWGDENKELDIDLYTIKTHTSIINVAQHLYDFVSLGIPMKRIHPQYKIMSDQL